MNRGPSSSRSSAPRGTDPPPQQTAWWVVGIAVVLFGGGLLLRHVMQGPPPETAPVLPVREPPHFQLTPRVPRLPQARSDDDFDASSDGPVAAPAKPAAGARAANATKPSGAAARPESSTAGGAQPVDAAGDALAVGTPDHSGGQPLPNGVSMSLSFDSSTATADQTEPIVAENVAVDPTLGALFPPNAMLAYPDRGGVDPQEGTIAFWVRMEWDPASAVEGKALADMSTGTWENRFELRLGPRYIGLLLTTSDGVEQGCGAAMQWTKGEWHHVAVEWGDSVMQMYIDGTLRDDRMYEGTVELPPTAPLYVGSQPKGPANQGAVRLWKWTVFQRILSPDEITALMMQTAPPAGAAPPA